MIAIMEIFVVSLIYGCLCAWDVRHSTAKADLKEIRRREHEND